MFEKFKFLALLIIPVVLIINTYILVGILYNNIRSNNIKIKYSDVEDYIEYDGIEIEIVDTNTFKNIFEQVFELNAECELFDINCKSSKEILSIIDNHLEKLYKELDFIDVSKDEVESSTFIMLNSLYNERAGVSYDKLLMYDQIFDYNSVKSALSFNIVLLLIILVLAITSWLKYSGVVFTISSTACIILMLFAKLITLFMTASGKRIILAIYINKLSDICLKRCYSFLIIGLVLLIIHFIYNKVVKSLCVKA